MSAKILITDDAAFMRAMLRKVLEQHGYEVIGEAANGREAVEKYVQLRPDVVTMDITMPEMNGIDAIKEIMKIDPSARIVVCSAMGQKPMVIEALSAGAKDFLVKPFEPARVIQAIEKVIK